MFTWPPGLLALLLVPVLFWAYRALLRGRAPTELEATPLQLVETTSGRAVGRRRHVPPLFYLSGITLLLLSLSRPTAPLSIPRLQGTVVLAFDGTRLPAPAFRHVETGTWLLYAPRVRAPFTVELAGTLDLDAAPADYPAFRDALAGALRAAGFTVNDAGCDGDDPSR